mmetsp:Transcript_63000/g.146703  ORF Transcript_63000/g.146703 Transcript_63000/m.146703 type:complete len:369 (-) Transcript_63000:757-1863(-)
MLAPMTSGQCRGASGHNTKVPLIPLRATMAPSFSPAPRWKHASRSEVLTTWGTGTPNGGPHLSKCGGSLGNWCQMRDGSSFMITSPGRSARGTRVSTFTFRSGGSGISRQREKGRTWGSPPLEGTSCRRPAFCSSRSCCSYSSMSADGTKTFGSPEKCKREKFPGTTVQQSFHGSLASKLHKRGAADENVLLCRKTRWYGREEAAAVLPAFVTAKRTRPLAKTSTLWSAKMVLCFMSCMPCRCRRNHKTFLINVKVGVDSLYPACHKGGCQASTFEGSEVPSTSPRCSCSAPYSTTGSPSMPSTQSKALWYSKRSPFNCCTNLGRSLLSKKLSNNRPPANAASVAIHAAKSAIGLCLGPGTKTLRSVK